MRIDLSGIELPRWQNHARCRDISDPDRFFIEPERSPAAAKRLCNHCPVQEMCLQYAIDNEIEFGIWGGFTPRQRRAIAAGVA